MHERRFGDWSVDLEEKNAQETHRAGKKAARYGQVLDAFRRNGLKDTADYLHALL